MKIRNIIKLIVMFLLLIGGIWYTKYQWDMCRDAGMKFWYCIKHIG